MSQDWNDNVSLFLFNLFFGDQIGACQRGYLTWLSVQYFLNFLLNIYYLPTRKSSSQKAEERLFWAFIDFYIFCYCYAVPIKERFPDQLNLIKSSNIKIHNSVCLFDCTHTLTRLALSTSCLPPQSSPAPFSHPLSSLCLLLALLPLLAPHSILFGRHISFHIFLIKKKNHEVILSGNDILFFFKA